MRVAFSTILAVTFAAGALANPMRKRYEEVEIKTECTTVVTTEYVTLDQSIPTPSNPPVDQDVHKDGYEGYPGWPTEIKPPPETTPTPAPAPAPTTTTTPPPPPPVYPTTTPPTTTPPPEPPAATPTLAPTPTPTPPTDNSFEGTVLTEHNQKRALHGSPALEWDENLAKLGMDLSKTCVFGHDRSCQNIALGYSSPAAAIQDFYNEISLYNFNSPGFNSTVGHFTQVVWKAAKKVGCASFPCPAGDFLTCNYDTGNVVGPGGNSEETFRENVLPLI